MKNNHSSKELLLKAKGLMKKNLIFLGLVVAVACMKFIPETGAYFYLTHFNQMNRVIESYHEVQVVNGESGLQKAYAKEIAK